MNPLESKIYHLWGLLPLLAIDSTNGLEGMDTLHPDRREAVLSLACSLADEALTLARHPRMEAAHVES